MHVLVTGATGFLGGAIVRRLRARGHTVRATGRNVAIGAALGVPFLPADLTRPEQTVGLCRDIDVVVHNAGLASPWGPRELFERTNVYATRSLLRDAERAQVGRVVYVSTSTVYTRLRDQFGLDEDSPLPRPINDYARTKRVAEREVLRASTPAIVLRPRGLFGPGDPIIVPRLIRALESKRLPIFGAGETIGDLTYVDNAADAVALAVDAPESATGGIYNVTSGEPVRIWDFIARVAAGLGLEPPSGNVPFSVIYGAAGLLELARSGGGEEPLITRYSATVLGRSLTLDITRARRVLGYTPRVSMEEGLARFLESWRAGAPA